MCIIQLNACLEGLIHLTVFFLSLFCIRKIMRKSSPFVRPVTISTNRRGDMEGNSRWVEVQQLRHVLLIYPPHLASEMAMLRYSAGELGCSLFSS